jgi:hypothetical protein
VKKFKRTLIMVAAGLGMVVVGTATATAAPTYCLPGGTNADGLQLSDVTFRLNPADDCYGVVAGNNPSDPALLSLWGGGWGADVRDDGAPGTVNYLGISWTLSAPQNNTTGSWSLTLADSPPTSLPLTVDIVAVVKASDQWAAYLFTGESFTTVGPAGGTFTINFLNNGDQTPGLSHMDLYLRPGVTVTAVADGDPAVLLMLGIGFAVTACGKRFSALNDLRS